MNSYCVRIERRPESTTFLVERVKGPVVEMLAMDATPAAIIHLEAEDEADAASKAWHKVWEIGGEILRRDYETKKLQESESK